VSIDQATNESSSQIRQNLNKCYNNQSSGKANNTRLLPKLQKINNVCRKQIVTTITTQQHYSSQPNTEASKKIINKITTRVTAKKQQSTAMLKQKEI
jgi:lipopolysaccharide biosynthesis regulator YciM